MTETVTDIIVARSRSQDRLKTMIVWSLGLHAAVIVGLLFAPAAASDPQRIVMSISLSGSEGPKTQGMTQAGAQPVRPPQPVEEKRPVVAPPKERPEMTIPDPKAKTRLEKPKAQAVESQPAANTAPAPTRVRGQGFGLSTSGGRGLEGVQVDALNFCCEEYLLLMRDAIMAKWKSQQNLVGTNVMIFTVLKDGSITAVAVERGSGFQALDDESRHALLATARLSPLPQAYPNQTLTVHLRFDYTR
jgi:TonB family protein